MQTPSELEQPAWAVITRSGVIATDLPYEEARALAHQSESMRPELSTCIVTRETAARMGKREEAADA
jgi:hypothetical protein